MRFFHDLGLEIFGHWKGADFDPQAFPTLAATALRERPPSAHVDPLDVVRWVHETPSLPPQADVDSEFGQPAITVFRCDEFYIDVLFWVDGTTGVHQHRFAGAFHVMKGSSLQSLYQFHMRREYNERLLHGDLSLLGVELLKAGDIRAIHSGKDLIHALFHMDRPSVSVVVRTPYDRLAGPQYHYSRSGLAHDPFATTQGTHKKLQTLELLHKVQDPAFETVARDSVRRADSFAAFKLLKLMMGWFGAPERFHAFIETIRPVHDALLDSMKVLAEEGFRERHIIVRRQIAKGAEHRFLLALLLNVPDRANIFKMIRSAYPDREPIDTLIRWLAELAKVDSINSWVGTMAKEGDVLKILDVDCDEKGLRVARHLLEGGDEEGLLARFNADDGAALRVACAAFRKSLLLRPLFTP